ncbi:MAG: iron-containing alcohol dehydrogenase, partial [Deltaproteobacteria bacterium]|nr:iron-containing alcohol dehydrogenase [Deltaproteobacteria bacterium]
GGSPIGLGKAIKRELDGQVRLVTVVTTFSGSEMTDYFGIRRGQSKEVGKDARCRPDHVVYDPKLVAGLPVDIAVPSLFNAMAHAVDSLYPATSGPENAALAKDAIVSLARAAEQIASEPDDGAWPDALFGAYRAATILGHAGMALHHKLAHVVAGSQNLPHAPTHTALLPHVVSFNRGARPDADEILCAALATDDPAGTIFDIAEAAGAEMRLAEHGFTREAVHSCADAVAAASFENPRSASAEDMVSLLDDVRLGRRPSFRRILGSPATGATPHAGLRPLIAGVSPDRAKLGVVLIQGRGSTAERTWKLFAPSLGALADRLAVIAVQADDRTWYPKGFRVPIADNQPGLDSALAVVDGMIDRFAARGLPRERVVLVGFSQGACLAMDYAARSGTGLAGVCAIAGGLIGDDAPAERHGAELARMPMVAGVAREDRWIDYQVAVSSRQHLEKLGARVDARDHDGEHTITDEQHQAIHSLLEALSQS